MAQADLVQKFLTAEPKRVAVYLLATYVLYCLVALVLRGFTSPLRHLPGPWHTRFTHWVLKYHVIAGSRAFYIDKLHRQYGQTVRLAPYEADFMDPESFKKIHHVSSKFIKDPWYEAVNFLPRPSIFHTRDPKDHSERRKLIAKNLSVAHLRQHFDKVVRDDCKLCVEKIIMRSKECTTQDLLFWARLVCQDVLGSVVFGESFGMLEKEERTEHIRVLDTALLFGGFTSEMTWLRAVGRRLPFKIFQDAYNRVGYIMSAADPAVKHARSSDETTGPKTVLASVLEDQKKDKGKGQRQWDDTDIQIEALTLLIAGAGATATVLGFALWQILEMPELQRALEEEAKNLPDNFDDAMMEARSPLLNATLFEANRLWAGVPSSLPRVSPPEGATLAGYQIPAGVTVCTSAYSMHRDPKIWKDPMKFDPARFLPGADLHPDAKSILSGFGAGAYACLGPNLAKMKMRYMITMLFRACPGIKLASVTPKLEENSLITWIAIIPKSDKILADFSDVKVAEKW